MPLAELLNKSEKVVKEALARAFADDEYDRILIEYRLLRSYLTALLQDQSNFDKKKEALELCRFLLWVNEEILSEKYRKLYAYEQKTFQEQQNKYRKALDEQEIQVQQYNLNIFTQLVLENHAAFNNLRLTLVRTRRILLLTLKLFLDTNQKTQLNNIDLWLGGIFEVFSWLVYLPRLIIRFSALAENTIPGFWMEKEQADLAYSLRLITELRLYWFDIFNDLPWLIIGFLNCYILVGGLAIVATYLTIAFFAYDIALAGIRASITLIDLYSLKEGYQQEEALAVIDQHIRYQWLRGSLNLSNTIALFIGICFTIPAIIAMQVTLIPIIGASISLGVTLATYVLSKLIDKYFAPASEPNLDAFNTITFEDPRAHESLTPI